MRDLTEGPISTHLLGMAAFIGMGLIFQTLYFIVDLYFVSRLGSAAIAGVSAAGNVFFVALAATQLVAVGAMALVSQSVGAKDEAAANTYAAQSLSMGFAFTIAMLVLGYAFGGAFITALTADEATAAQGRAFLYAYLPSLALMFPGNAMMSALRGVGVVMETMWLQTGTVLLNALLAPILIVGWGTGVPLGAAGAGLASTIANVVGFIALMYLFPRVQTYLRIYWNALAPKLAAWRRILFVGLPTSLEFLMMFIIIALTYWAIRDFGADAQAGLGIGGRIMQSIFLPAMAIAFAAGPVAGQNFGARKYDRVRETFRATALFGSAIMLTLTVLCHLNPELMVRPFTDDPEVVGVAADYLRIASWNFVANGLVMAASSMFQGMGDTRPSLIASATRLITFALPAIWLSFQPDTTLEQFWWLGVASILLQCAISLTLLYRMFGKKLAPAAA